MGGSCLSQTYISSMEYEGMKWGSLQCAWLGFMRLEYEINL